MRIKQSASSKWLQFCGITCTLILLTMAGCGDSDSEPEPELTAAEYFKANQVPTMTGNGKIDIESVKELDGDWIQYTTEDGKKFKVHWTRKAGPDGTTYTYDNSEEIELDQDAD
jgi:hypothetical protein